MASLPCGCARSPQFEDFAYVLVTLDYWYVAVFLLAIDCLWVLLVCVAQLRGNEKKHRRHAAQNVWPHGKSSVGCRSLPAISS